MQVKLRCAKLRCVCNGSIGRTQSLLFPANFNATAATSDDSDVRWFNGARLALTPSKSRAAAWAWCWCPCPPAPAPLSPPLLSSSPISVTLSLAPPGLEPAGRRRRRNRGVHCLVPGRTFSDARTSPTRLDVGCESMSIQECLLSTRATVRRVKESGSLLAGNIVSEV